ncbi:hypothetical protein [Oceanitalea stevensii]|uniref:DUF4190 domain-containing protein n=1 Tax=Oceanitalea stevensii TaxID=2763072 RepID=A0ABR8Z212_9MICO|nr:hypothetical protein [Oceanitalea stevensii]MBD8062359.1 hypothetical protein [Oceanitalea stevensii]
MSEPSTEGNRHGTWSLTLGVLGLLALLAPAATAVVLLGTVVSITAVVLGVNGVLAASGGRATNRPQAVAGILLGALHN